MGSTGTTDNIPPNQAETAPAPTRYESALKIRVDADVKAALIYAHGTATDEAVKYLLMSPSGIDDLANSVIMRNYTEVFTPGSKLMHVSLSVGEYRDWHRSYPNPHWCVDAMEAMKSAGPEMRSIFTRPATNVLLPIEGADLTHDLEEEVKCYRLTGLSEADSQQLVNEQFYFCQRYSVIENPAIDRDDSHYLQKLLGGLMAEYCKRMGELRAADPFTRFALAKKIMGDYMYTQTVQSPLAAARADNAPAEAKP